ncbi:MAG TPA: D-TA family PLP-dependent enzyme [Vicinamibacterales bacterium]
MWYQVRNVNDVPSPALLVYPDRAAENLRRLVTIAGRPERLRPHMKTHKMPAIARLYLAAGITRAKCATIAEAEMLAEAGMPDVLLACQPVGPGATRLAALASRYPTTRFSAIVDDEAAARAIDQAFAQSGLRIELLVDLDVGMHRTGIEPEHAAPLYHRIARLHAASPGGLHAYDGHLHDADRAARCARASEGLARVLRLRDQLRADGLPVPRIVAGGTPTFPCHAASEEPDLELSPGTIVFWDAGYAAGLPDLPFLAAALLLTRVISKPGGSRVCLDLGHKAVASEMPHPRALLVPAHADEPAPRAPGLDLPCLDARFVGHSEEHLVIETPIADRLRVGDHLYAVPWHVCPTVALHGVAHVVRDGRVEERWPVTARERVLTV